MNLGRPLLSISVAESRAQSRRYLAASLALAIVAMVTLVGVDRFGKASRSYGDVRPIAEVPKVAIARDAEHAVELWRASGLRGRILVHLGEYLHFIEPGVKYPDERLGQFPYDIEDTMARHAGDPGLLWVLMRINVARELHNVLPSDVYTNKVGAGGGAPGERSTVQATYGLRRTISDHLIAFDEPVLLSVDASLFASPDGRELAVELRSSSLRTDMVVCNLAEDNPRVSDGARARLRQFARELGGPLAQP